MLLDSTDIYICLTADLIQIPMFRCRLSIIIGFKSVIYEP